MNSVEKALRGIAADLTALQLRWALIGGLAVSARAEPRFTRDVDVVVLVRDDGAAEQVVRSLVAGGYALLGTVEQEAVGRLATARLASPGDGGLGVVVDLVFATAGIEPEIVASAEAVEVLPGLTVPVAAAGHLVALKLLARDDVTRPQDASDLRALAPVLVEHDRELARRAVRLMQRRGFGRGRALEALLEEYLQRHASG